MLMKKNIKKKTARIRKCYGGHVWNLKATWRRWMGQGDQGCRYKVLIINGDLLCPHTGLANQTSDRPNGGAAMEVYRQCTVIHNGCSCSNHLNMLVEMLYACQGGKVEVGLALHVYPTYM